MMKKDDCFIFKSCRYDAPKRTLSLDYAYESGPEFTETILFPEARTTFSAKEHFVLDRAMKALHLAAGISYYKAFCPARIRLENQRIGPDEAAFFTRFYLLGLGEFAACNDLDLQETIRFPHTADVQPDLGPAILPAATVLPIGGGKDSLVSLEILKKARHPFRPLAVNAGPPILAVLDQADCPPPILIQRRLDPALFALNDQGAYNGHVPISGILSFIMAFAAVLYGFDTVVMSNEQSANEGNMIRNNIEVNHQYSKSLDFEKDFNVFMRRHGVAGFRYFSLLRPLSESGIAALFARHPVYFPLFKSCNRNFHIAEQARRYGWCGCCPKCHFVFLALAPFIGRSGMVDIFGRDLLDDPAQEDGFRALLGLLGHKPFECVGTLEECRLLLKSLSLDKDWQTSRLVPLLAAEIKEPGLALPALAATVLRRYPDHNIPADFERMLDDFIRA